MGDDLGRNKGGSTPLPSCPLTQCHAQGAHGLWELSVNKAYHADLLEDLLEALVTQLASPELQVSLPMHSVLQC